MEEHKSEAFFQIGQEVVENRYKIIRQLGKGSFGQVFKASHIVSGEYVAIKFQLLGETDNPHDTGQLGDEARKMTDLKGTSIPQVHMSGELRNNGFRYYYIVMDFMNMNLTDLMRRNVEGTLSEKSTLLATVQIIRLLKTIHDQGYIHRDLKPDNFVIGISEVTRKMLFIVDFGLAGKYKNPDGTFKPFNERSGSYFGTPAYMSVFSHKTSTVTRRDDLESLGYVALKLLTGTTPWLEALRGRSFTSDEQKKQRNLMIMEMKQKPLQEIFAEMPHPYLEFMERVKNLGFTETPQYEEYCKLFEDYMLNEKGWDPSDVDFDWSKRDTDEMLDTLTQKLEMFMEELKIEF